MGMGVGMTWLGPTICGSTVAENGGGHGDGDGGRVTESLSVSSVLLLDSAGGGDCCFSASIGSYIPEADDDGRVSPLFFGSGVDGVIVAALAALSTPRVPFGLMLTIRVSGTPTISCNSGGKIFVVFCHH
ncbi:hypothetical protein QVD17_18895 [Tagetes erecta]|uniref:Uncharacterized protein n=1 Tax=Tagetes erecta TaxID=13708 RepID=A0AAD8KLJ8_TARER|nr:hypothetical protein QVD17_18895 [Tagetes erecta]